MEAGARATPGAVAEKSVTLRLEAMLSKTRISQDLYKSYSVDFFKSNDAELMQ